MDFSESEYPVLTNHTNFRDQFRHKPVFAGSAPPQPHNPAPVLPPTEQQAPAQIEPPQPGDEEGVFTLTPKTVFRYTRDFVVKYPWICGAFLVCILILIYIIYLLQQQQGASLAQVLADHGLIPTKGSTEQEGSDDDDDGSSGEEEETDEDEQEDDEEKKE